MAENCLAQTSNNARKTLDVIMLSLNKLMSYVVNNAETYSHKIFVLGKFKTGKLLKL